MRERLRDNGYNNLLAALHKLDTSNLKKLRNEITVHSEEYASLNENSENEFVNFLKIWKEVIKNPDGSDRNISQLNADDSYSNIESLEKVHLVIDILKGIVKDSRDLQKTLLVSSEQNKLRFEDTRSESLERAVKSLQILENHFTSKVEKEVSNLHKNLDKLVYNLENLKMSNLEKLFTDIANNQPTKTFQKNILNIHKILGPTLDAYYHITKQFTDSNKDHISVNLLRYFKSLQERNPQYDLISFFEKINSIMKIHYMIDPAAPESNQDSEIKKVAQSFVFLQKVLYEVTKPQNTEKFLNELTSLYNNYAAAITSNENKASQYANENSNILSASIQNIKSFQNGTISLEQCVTNMENDTRAAKNIKPITTMNKMFNFQSDTSKSLEKILGKLHDMQIALGEHASNTKKYKI